jgi:YbgC/YbaW family acyl-CoA thioester hydrolase
MSTFVAHSTVRLQHTDAAGILFFANQLIFAHEAYEKFMEHIGHSFVSIFDSSDYIIPIVHAEADYVGPLRVGDAITVELTIENIGNSSFVIAYYIRAVDGTEVGKCRTVHVAADRNSQSKIPIPASLRNALERFRESSAHVDP